MSVIVMDCPGLAKGSVSRESGISHSSSAVNKKTCISCVVCLSDEI